MLNIGVSENVKLGSSAAVAVDQVKIERDAVRALHKAIRSDHSEGDRYRILAWAFIRGMKYRRVERSHHMQSLPRDSYFAGASGFYLDPEGRCWFEHNLPDAVRLTRLLAKHMPELSADFKNGWSLKENTAIQAWLADRSGAVPAPAPRPKKPYVRPETGAQ